MPEPTPKCKLTSSSQRTPPTGASFCTTRRISVVASHAAFAFLSRTLRSFLLISACGLPVLAAAQSAPPPAPQQFQGCVQPSPTDKTTLILSAESACAKLTGKFSATALAGHLVDLKGVLTPRTPAAPASIRVDSVLSVGKACSNVCPLRPPGTRGLGGGEVPGKEGGTPGEAPTPTPPPQ